MFTSLMSPKGTNAACSTASVTCSSRPPAPRGRERREEDQTRVVGAARATRVSTGTRTDIQRRLRVRHETTGAVSAPLGVARGKGARLLSDDALFLTFRFIGGLGQPRPDETDPRNRFRGSSERRVSSREFPRAPRSTRKLLSRAPLPPARRHISQHGYVCPQVRALFVTRRRGISRARETRASLPAPSSPRGVAAPHLSRTDVQEDRRESL